MCANHSIANSTSNTAQAADGPGLSYETVRAATSRIESRLVMTHTFNPSHIPLAQEFGATWDEAELEELRGFLIQEARLGHWAPLEEVAL